MKHDETFRRTDAEQQFWDAVFLQQLQDHTRSRVRGPRDGSEYCAHMAREIADAALAERRRSAFEEVAHG